MLYPRVTTDGKLVSEDQVVGYKEHFTKKYRILFMAGVIIGESDFHNLLLTLDSLSHEPIKIVINSPGGDLDSTFLLYDTMKLIQSPVITYGRYCASAAAIILAAGQKRYLSPHSKTMLHLGANFFTRDTAIPFQDMKIIQKETKKAQDEVVKVLIDCGVRRTPEQLLIDIDRDFWLEPKDAVEYGLADEMMTTEVWQSWTKEVAQ